MKCSFTIRVERMKMRPPAELRSVMGTLLVLIGGNLLLKKMIMLPSSIRKEPMAMRLTVV